jgi:hypothetical protein
LLISGEAQTELEAERSKDHSVPASVREATTRFEKGWAIYSEHASEIIASYSKGVWLVSSQSDDTSVYEVRLDRRGTDC